MRVPGQRTRGSDVWVRRSGKARRRPPRRGWGWQLPLAAAIFTVGAGLLALAAWLA